MKMKKVKMMSSLTFSTYWTEGANQTTVLTTRPSHLHRKKPTAPTPTRASENTEGRDTDEEEEEEESDEEDPFTPSDEDDAAPEALENLQNFISTLDTSSKKRKPSAEDLPIDAPPRKRRILKERTEAGEENEFRTHGAGNILSLCLWQSFLTYSKGFKLNLDDLFGAPCVATRHTSFFEKIYQGPQSLLVIQNTYIVSTTSARAQERLDREAAYEKTKEEVDKWSATMKRIQEVHENVHRLYGI